MWKRCLIAHENTKKTRTHDRRLEKKNKRNKAEKHHLRAREGDDKLAGMLVSAAHSDISLHQVALGIVFFFFEEGKKKKKRINKETTSSIKSLDIHNSPLFACYAI